MSSDDTVNEDPVTVCIDQLKNADDAAAAKIWNHFVQRLYDSARKKLSPRSRATYSEEDAAQSAFHSVCAGVAAGRFPDLNDRDSLWKLMLVITSRKISRRHRYDHRERRDVRRNLGQGVFQDGTSDESIDDPVNRLASPEPTPEFAAEFVETCEALFDSLDDEQLQEVVRFRLEGFTDSEIAERLNCSRRTVQRSLEVIRRRWRNQESIDE